MAAMVFLNIKKIFNHKDNDEHEQIKLTGPITQEFLEYLETLDFEDISRYISWRLNQKPEKAKLSFQLNSTEHMSIYPIPEFVWEKATTVSSIWLSFARCDPFWSDRIEFKKEQTMLELMKEIYTYYNVKCVNKKYNAYLEKYELFVVGPVKHRIEAMGDSIYFEGFWRKGADLVLSYGS